MSRSLCAHLLMAPKAPKRTASSAALRPESRSPEPRKSPQPAPGKPRVGGPPWLRGAAPAKSAVHFREVRAINSMSEDPSSETQASLPPPDGNQRVLNSQAADTLLDRRVRAQLGGRARQALKTAGLLLVACATTAITTAALDRHQPATSQQPARPPAHAAATPRSPHPSSADRPNAHKSHQQGGFQGIRLAHPSAQPRARTESTPAAVQPATAPEPPPASPPPPASSAPATAEEQTKGGPFSP